MTQDLEKLAESLLAAAEMIKNKEVPLSWCVVPVEVDGEKCLAYYSPDGEVVILCDDMGEDE